MISRRMESLTGVLAAHDLPHVNVRGGMPQHLASGFITVRTNGMNRANTIAFAGP